MVSIETPAARVVPRGKGRRDVIAALLALLGGRERATIVVQPRHGAFPELIEETGGGVLCEPDDPDDLAARLTDLLLDPARIRDLGEKGRAAVLDRFTVRHMAEGVLEVFEEALRRRGG